MAIKTFASGEVLTAADTNTYLANSGLVYVKSQTVGTGVTQVDVTNCFSTNYDNYKIIYSGYTGSANEPLKMRLGSTATSIYYGAGSLNEYSTTTTIIVNDNPQAFFRYVGGSGTSGAITDIDVYAPFLTTKTFVQANTVRYSTFALGTYGGFIDNSVSYTGFSLFGFTTGTMTGGTITVYGYRKA